MRCSHWDILALYHRGQTLQIPDNESSSHVLQGLPHTLVTKPGENFGLRVGSLELLTEVGNALGRAEIPHLVMGVVLEVPYVLFVFVGKAFDSWPI